MFHQGVRGGHEHAVVTVVPTDQVRGRTALPVNLDDNAFAVLIANMAAPDNDLVTHLSVHRDLLLPDSRSRGVRLAYPAAALTRPFLSVKPGPGGPIRWT
jgi:hypothetical protein